MKLAIFDFDGTLFTKDTLPFLLSRWKELKYSKTKYIKAYYSLIFLYIKYKLGIKTKLSREEMKLTAVKKFNNIFSGMSEVEIMRYFINSSKDIEHLFNKSVISELKNASLQGYHTVLLSGSYYNFLKSIGESLDFDTIIGTKMYFDNDIFDPSKTIEIISGPLKSQKILEYFQDKSVNWKESRAYADSYSDIDILKLVGHPIAVNPENELKSIATEMNWKIIN